MGEKNSLAINTKKKINCLVLPEGIDTECKSLINFTIKCAKNNPKIKFILRFHPSTNVKKLLFSIKFLDSIKDYSNVVISKKSLLSDIKRSSICFYRGSTSVITAVQYGVFPLYIDFENKLNIDPMYRINHLICYLKTFKDFKLIALILLSTIKLSSTKATMSSSYICFFLSAKTLNFPKAAWIISSVRSE